MAPELTFITKKDSKNLKIILVNIKVGIYLQPCFTKGRHISVKRLMVKFSL